MAYFYHLTRTPKSQQGMILITVLVILATLTLLVLSALSTSTLEYQMSHNSSVQLQAFLNAESELNNAAVQIKQGNFPAATSGYDIEVLPEKNCNATVCLKVMAIGRSTQVQVMVFAQYQLQVAPKTKQRTLTRTAWWIAE